MIRFQSIQVRNFMSVGNEWLTFDYGTGLFYVYGENEDVDNGSDVSNISNGTGKTVVLVDAPLFALYGRTQRKIKKHELVNIQNQSDCEVKLTLQKDGDVYIIERGLKPDKVVIYKNGEPEVEEAKKRKVNRIIEEEILDGISFEVFKNLIVLNGNTSKHFFEYGKNEKRNFINEVFRLGFLEYLQINLTNTLKEKKEELDRKNVQITSKKEEIERLRKLYQSIQSGNEKETNQEIQKKIEDEKKKLEAAKQKVQTIEQTVFQGDKKTQEERIANAQKKIESTNAEIVRLDSEVNNCRQRYTTLKKQFEQILQQNECPQCTQPIPDTLKQKLKDKIVSSRNEIIQKAQEVKAAKESRQQKIPVMREWLKKANEALTEYNNTISFISNSSLLMEEYSKQIQSKSGYNLDSITKEIEELERAYKTICDEYKNLEHDFNTHKVCRDLVGGKNFYGYYISVFRKYLNNSINEYLNKMASTHHVKFNNDLEADVFDGEQSVHSYDNLSTGEKSKINIALLLSFFDVLNSFHRMETNILVLDEVLDTGLDTSAVRLLLNILQEKVSERQDIGIYVVSHKDANSSFAAQENAGKIVFQKRLGFTTIKEN